MIPACVFYFCSHYSTQLLSRRFCDFAIAKQYETAYLTGVNYPSTFHHKGIVLRITLMIPKITANAGIHIILTLFTMISTMIITNPISPPAMANNHVNPAKKIIPETVNTARFVRAVEVPPLSGPTFEIIIRTTAQIIASIENTSAMTEKTTGTADGFFSC